MESSCETRSMSLCSDTWSCVCNWLLQKKLLSPQVTFLVKSNYSLSVQPISVSCSFPCVFNFICSEKFGGAPFYQDRQTKSTEILRHLVNSVQCCLLLQQRLPWGHGRPDASKRHWSGPTARWGQWSDTAAPGFLPVSPHWLTVYRAEAEPGKERGEGVCRPTKTGWGETQPRCRSFTK